MKKISIPPDSNPSSLLTIEQAAISKNVSVRTMHNWMKAKVISAIKIGRVVRFDPGTLREELARFSTK